MHRRFGPRQQRMPFRQSFSFREQTIGAGHWQPFKSRQIIARQFDAVRLVLESTFVITALTGLDIELFTRDVGKIDLVGVFIHQLMQAALTTPIT